MKAIILAAGVGKRLWPVTQHKPKCLIEIGDDVRNGFETDRQADIVRSDPSGRLLLLR